MHANPDLAEVAALIGDPSRAAMLLSLLGGKTLPEIWPGRPGYHRKRPVPISPNCCRAACLSRKFADAISISALPAARLARP